MVKYINEDFTRVLNRKEHPILAIIINDVDSQLLSIAKINVVVSSCGPGVDHSPDQMDQMVSNH